MNALEIVQDISEALGFDVPVTITNKADTNTRRILKFVNSGIEQIRLAYPWQVLQREAVFDAFVNNPNYNPKTGGINLKTQIPDLGSIITPQLYEANSLQDIKYLAPAQFEHLKISGVGTANKYFSIYGSALYFLPQLTEESYKVVFRYVSKYAVKEVENNTNKYKSRFTKDSDICDFDDELVLLCGLYKVKQELGFDYADNQADYEERLEALKNMDTIAPVLKGVSVVNTKAALNIPEVITGNWEKR